MKQTACLLACIALCARSAAADPEDKHRVRHLVGIGVAIGLYVTSETVAKDALAPDAFSHPDASSPSWFRRYASASPPIPSPVRKRKSRREVYGVLLDIEELIEIEDDVAQIR